MDFNEFKSKLKNLQAGIEKIKQNEKKGYSKDERIWYPTLDKSGNAYVLLRFLPQKDPTLEPIIEIHRHAFQLNGRWIIEVCPKTKDWSEPCPICEYSNALFNEGNDFARDVWRRRERWVNVYIKNDKNNPENNGKVFLYKLPVTVYNMIMAKVAPEMPEDEPVMVFDFFEGMDFKLKVTQKGGYNNYDLSEFTGKITPIAETEAEMKQIYEQIHDLEIFKQQAIESIKPYDKLKAILNDALGVEIPTQVNRPEVNKQGKQPKQKEEVDEDDIDFDDDLDDIDDVDF